MNVILHSRVALGDMEACTWLDADTGAAGLMLIPAGMDPLPFSAKHQNIDSMVQLKLVGDPYPGSFSSGVTMRGSASTAALRLKDQQVSVTDTGAEICTTLEDGRGHTVVHQLVWEGGSWLRSRTRFENHADADATLELLTSFSISGLTPFTPGDAANTLLLHRARGVWSMEGRLDTQTLEQLQLEPSWTYHGVRCERFGQVGSMPCNHWFPWMVVEDTANHVFWGAQIAHNASWQMEAFRQDDGLAISGGLADWDFGRWRKRVAPGESFVTPDAILTVCRAAALDDAACRLTAAATPAVNAGPASEQELPVMFNEYCTTWTNPTLERLMPVLEAVKNKGFAYFVIDAGWFKNEDKYNWEQAMGDYVPSRLLYPNGIHVISDAIREAGMVPGLWFELDGVGCTSHAWQQTEDLLWRDGQPLQVGARRFRAMAKPEVRQKLHRIVTDLLKENGFGYIKIDYNDSIGPGCDGYESDGEGLRQTAVGSAAFIREMKEAIPGLIVENCASGGHRLEPLMLGLTTLSSFSDAHECEEIPIIAANMHRLMLPRQCQIWAVLRADDSERRLVYSLANTLLGRMCVSGDVDRLTPRQWQVVDDGIAFYQKSVPYIRDGVTRRYGPEVAAYRHPTGWQAVVRLIPGRGALLVLHVFAQPYPQTISFDLPFDDYTPEEVYTSEPNTLTIEGAHLRYTPAAPMTALAVLLRQPPRAPQWVEDDD